MAALPDHYRVLVAGAGGAIGAAFVERLRSDARCGAVHLLGRHTDPPLDYGSEDSVATAADALRAFAPFHRVIVATGVLSTVVAQPEKRLADLRLSAMEEVFRINTFGPGLMLRHFAPLLDRQCSVMALLSARVGSIGDNRLGGWYSYRASKAALNMMVRTAAIEIRRTHPGAVIVALHPGTVKSALSRPFRGDEIGRDPAQAAADMLTVLEALGPDDSGSFVAYDGQRIPW